MWISIPRFKCAEHEAVREGGATDIFRFRFALRKERILMEHLRCVVERITYQNAENGYTVLKCAVKNYNDLVTVV